jgi:hypothetical protein
MPRGSVLVSAPRLPAYTRAMSDQDRVPGASEGAAAAHPEETAAPTSGDGQAGIGTVTVDSTSTLLAPSGHTTVSAASATDAVAGGLGSDHFEFAAVASVSSEEAEASAILDRVERALPELERRVDRLMYRYGH